MCRYIMCGHGAPKHLLGCHMHLKHRYSWIRVRMFVRCVTPLYVRSPRSGPRSGGEWLEGLRGGPGAPRVVNGRGKAIATLPMRKACTFKHLITSEEYLRALFRVQRSLLNGLKIENLGGVARLSGRKRVTRPSVLPLSLLSIV